MMPPQIVRVLVIDDDQSYAEYIRRLLTDGTKGRYHVEYVSSSASGLEAMKSNQHDIYLLDYGLGAENGVELLREAIRRGCYRPIILLTGNEDPQVDMAAMEAGAADYLLKDEVKRANLERSIRYLLEERRVREALQQSERKLAEAQQLSHTGSWESDLETGTSLWSDEVYRLLGLQPREVTPTRGIFMEFVHRNDRGAVVHAITQSMEENEPYDVEFRICRQDGTERLLHSRGKVIRDASGKPLRMVGTVQDITVSRNAESRLKRVMSRARCVLWDAIVTDKGDWFDWEMYFSESELLYREFGLQRRNVETDAQMWNRILSTKPGQIERMNDACHAALHGGAAGFQQELTIIADDGREHWLKEDVSIALLSKGKWQLVGVAVDITERKLAEERLRRHAEQTLQHQEALLELAKMEFSDLDQAFQRITKLTAKALNVQAVTIWLLDHESRQYICHDRYDRSTGLHQRGDRSLISDYPNYQELFERCLTIAVRDVSTDPRVEEFADKLNAKGIISLLEVPIRSQGQLIGSILIDHVGTPRDWSPEEQEFVTFVSESTVVALETAERTRMEATLGERESENRATFDLISVGFAHFDVISGKFLRVNQAICAMTGYTESELLKMTLPEISHEDNRQSSATRMRLTTSGEATAYLHELQWTRKDGSAIWVLMNAMAIRDPVGKATHMVAIVQDISDRRAAEEKIRRLNAELEQRVANRTIELESTNKELESFTYSVSHDLRAPLRAINGFSRILEEQHSDTMPPEAKRLLRLIGKNTRQMGQLVDDLLQLSRVGRHTIRKDTVYTNQLVREVLDLLKTEHDGHKVGLSIGELPPCEGDPALLRQVFQNLIGNAFKYSRSKSLRLVEIGSKQDNGSLVFFVRDNGAGFDMKYADKLFGVFQRLHSADEFEGTGVGLAITRRIVERHGGRIWAEAEPGKGATFFFTLSKGI